MFVRIRWANVSGRLSLRLSPSKPLGIALAREMRKSSFSFCVREVRSIGNHRELRWRGQNHSTFALARLKEGNLGHIRRDFPLRASRTHILDEGTQISLANVILECDKSLLLEASLPHLLANEEVRPRRAAKLGGPLALGPNPRSPDLARPRLHTTLPDQCCQ